MSGAFIGLDTENALFTSQKQRPVFDPNELNRRRRLQSEKIRQKTAISLSGLGPGGDEQTILSRRRP